MQFIRDLFKGRNIGILGKKMRLLKSVQDVCFSTFSPFFVSSFPIGINRPSVINLTSAVFIAIKEA